MAASEIRRHKAVPPDVVNAAIVRVATPFRWCRWAPPENDHTLHRQHMIVTNSADADSSRVILQSHAQPSATLFRK